MYFRQQSLPSPAALFRLTTEESPVRERNGADILAQHGLAVNVPLQMPVTPRIEVWETADGAWWLDQLAQDLSTPDYSIATYAAEHQIQAFANNETTAFLGTEIAQQLVTRNSPIHQGKQLKPKLVLFDVFWPVLRT